MHTHTTTNREETIRLGEQLGKRLEDSAIIALESDLGGGKTTLVQGMAKGLGIKTNVTSPTFVLERIYQIPGRKSALHHYDLYRIEPDDLLVQEILENAKSNIVAIEWSEKISERLPADTIKISIETAQDADTRIITIQEPSDQ